MNRKRFAFSLAGGLTIGFLCFGLALALVFFVIRPSIERGTHGLRAYRQGDVCVWHAGGELDAAELDSVCAETAALLRESTASIGVDPQALPLPIQVFWHRDVNELIDSVINRDSDYRSVNWAALDRLPWEDPRLRVSELVLAYGWGECTSQILYAGTALYATYPDRNFHAFVAALPEAARHSVGELLSLESAGSFPETFYQAYASPYVMRFGISLAATKRHFDIPKFFSHVPEEHQLYLESASLVQYLIEQRGSLDAVRAAWDVGSSVSLLARLTDLPPEELTAAWYEAALRLGLASPDYPVQHARLLIESGDCDGAFEITSGWPVAGATPEQLELMLVSFVLVGEFNRARALIDRDSGESVDPDVLRWSEHLLGGSTVTSGPVRIVSAASIPSEAELRRVRETVEAIGETLGDAGSVGTTTAVVYADPDVRELAACVTSSSGIRSALTHAMAGEDVALAVANVLPSFLLGETRSKLLRRGLTRLVNGDRRELIAEAVRLHGRGKWRPFGMLSYTGHDASEADVQSACLVQAILDEFGAAKLRDIWRSTSTLGEGYCLDTALRTHTGITREKLEEKILANVSGAL